MKFICLLVLSLLYVTSVTGQTASFGEVSYTDLKMKECSFEKDANALILFNTADVSVNDVGTIIIKRHKRIKIFNDEAVSEGNITLKYLSKYADIKDIEAATINYDGNKTVINRVDRKQVYNQKVDKQYKAITFVLPSVKPGSIIDYRYTIKSYSVFPDWSFQDVLPTRYSSLTVDVTGLFPFRVQKKTGSGKLLDTLYSDQNRRIHKWALANIPSISIEPYTHSVDDNVKGIFFYSNRFNSWNFVSRHLLDDDDFGKQADLILPQESELLAKISKKESKKDKIAAIFEAVKQQVKWNGIDAGYTIDGVYNSWVKQQGNSTEINLILYHLLQIAGLNPSLLVFGTRETGELEIDNPGLARINKTVVRIPIDSVTYYVLDATGKNNSYNVTPYDLLGINMLPIETGLKNINLIQLKTQVPSSTTIFVNADISSDGTLAGKGQISSSNYARTSKLDMYNLKGEKKYVDEEIREDNHTIKISSYNRSNVNIDTLALREDFDFKSELTGSDSTYIYLNPNLFTGMGENPFVSEKRTSDVDFIFPRTFLINGRYIIPKGYKKDFLPNPIKLVMTDNSITFKRTIGEADGEITVHYVIDFKKTRYGADDYPALRSFYKKMYELLNEQIVLKKQP